MFHHTAKKSLGQNFLKNPHIIEKIANAAEITSSDAILEIGPGKGALTQALIARAKHVVAIEKDDQLTEFLHEHFAQALHDGSFEIIHGDVMTFDPETLLKHGSYKLVANIPYNITGAIIEKFLSTQFQPTTMVLMVQKEVADRIVAQNKKTGGDGKESILSIAVKVYSTPEYICTVKAGNFSPAPKVDSAVIKMSNISRNNFINKHHEEVFFQMLAGNLKNILEPEIVAQAMNESGLSSTVRPENVGISQWLSLSKKVYNAQYGS
jgi:16S rRNA (adenine1518-N6/adenine1519-N6)-dimethyltransferase